MKNQLEIFKEFSRKFFEFCAFSAKKDLREPLPRAWAQAHLPARSSGGGQVRGLREGYFFLKKYPSVVVYLSVIPTGEFFCIKTSEKIGENVLIITYHLGQSVAANRESADSALRQTVSP